VSIIGTGGAAEAAAAAAMVEKKSRRFTEVLYIVDTEGMNRAPELRRHLIDLLRGGNAHATFDQVVEDFPIASIGVRPTGMAHSAWELLEHLRFTQEDILKFSLSADYVEPKWPDDYWPKSSAPGSTEEWDKSIRRFRDDAAAFETLLQDTARDLYLPFPWGSGQTLLREALLIADHNAWHLGQLMLVRRALEAI